MVASWMMSLAGIALAHIADDEILRISFFEIRWRNKVFLTFFTEEEKGKVIALSAGFGGEG